MKAIPTIEELGCARPEHGMFGEWNLPSLAERKAEEIWRIYVRELAHRQRALQTIIRWEFGVAGENSESTWTQLEDAARTGNERAFIVALKRISLNNQSADNLVYIIRLALKAGAHLAARQISSEGLTRFPDDANIQKYARGLAPPRVIARNLPPNPSLEANREWLRANSAIYRGQWVAVQNGQLLAVASSLKELTEQIPHRENILFTKVR